MTKPRPFQQYYIQADQVLPEVPLNCLSICAGGRQDGPLTDEKIAQESESSKFILFHQERQNKLAWDLEKNVYFSIFLLLPTLTYT
jgi:hypothetical protein